MDLSTYPNGDGYVVEVMGALTAQERLVRIPEAVKRVVSEKNPPVVKLNVRHVEMVDLEGVAALAKSYRIAVDGGARFALIDGQPRVRRRL